MTTTYTRRLPLPDHSFFLFGPRGTGKTTWLRQRLPEAAWFDLLRLDTVLRLGREPTAFRAEVEALPRGSWIVVDEVQRLPALLDEVHSIVADHGSRYRFALSGSSARKLRRVEANLLAGRAITRKFFPLTGAELGFDVDVDDLLAFGTLPRVRSERSVAVDILDAYVGTYLREEIQQESLTRDVGTFARFLEVAALTNAQVVNVAGVARDAGVARPTVARFYEVLVDTLVGTWLPAWRSRARIKEVRHPKFYLFDPGVARALMGRIREPLEREERGALLETLVFHELRAAINEQGLGGDLSYWRTPAGAEVDFIWSRGKTRVGIEVKAARAWRADFGATLTGLCDEGTLTSAIGVYTGRERLKYKRLTVLPVAEFMRELTAGRVLAARPV